MVTGHRSALAARRIEKDLARFPGLDHNNRLKMWRRFCTFLVEHDGLAHDRSNGSRRAKTAKNAG